LEVRAIKLRDMGFDGLVVGRHFFYEEMLSG
jgi:hypothetical protein